MIGGIALAPDFGTARSADELYDRLEAYGQEEPERETDWRFDPMRNASALLGWSAVLETERLTFAEYVAGKGGVTCDELEAERNNGRSKEALGLVL